MSVDKLRAVSAVTARYHCETGLRNNSTNFTPIDNRRLILCKTFGPRPDVRGVEWKGSQRPHTSTSVSVAYSPSFAALPLHRFLSDRYSINNREADDTQVTSLALRVSTGVDDYPLFGGSLARSLLANAIKKKE
ncbi:hypothetical protein EVAR_36838_1 [Eumeta japonica]|uniref:Uncharacterized protein n=1 Tax=Eumeta variegata TaxID=151549 RepID=A0A4C1WE00_EUMVA|nr:hypothetical protein EVAR_36838_1 [Eumeta japonica]